MNNLSEIVGRLLNKDPTKPARSKESSSTTGEFTQSLQAALKDMETAGTTQNASGGKTTLQEDELTAVHHVTATVDEAAKTLDRLLEMKRLLLAALDRTRR